MKYLPQEIIRIKRNGGQLSADHLSDLSKGITSGEVSNAQIAAFAMAVFFQDLSVQERVDWTKAVVDSGKVLNWKETTVNGPIVDKHSTGGIGDGVSLILAPMLAACGAFVPMIAGRGLAHTGGTIDKLESIPGYNTSMDIDGFKKVVSSVGCSIVSQTSDLAPTDNRVYSVRDVTETVENKGLITASILSKKLAAGVETLILDVKTGNGAVMQSYEDSCALANALTDVANGAGMNTSAIVTDMSVPLSSNAGNSLEVIETIRFLKGKNSHPRLTECVYALGANLLVECGLVSNLNEANEKLSQTITSGSALIKFEKFIQAMGCNCDLVNKSNIILSNASFIKPLYSEKRGYVSDFDLRSIGYSVVELGGGRITPGERIDHSVGLENIAQIGDEVGPKSDSTKPICIIHAKNESDFINVSEKILNAVGISSEKVNCPPLILDTIR